MSYKVVQEIKQFMRQMDLTDMEKLEQLMEGYTSAVKEYNALCKRIRGLIKHNMVEEVERLLNEQETPLQEQYKELRQPAVKEFLETAELYGLTEPQLENVFEEIQGAMLNSMGIRPLIIRYRQVARSNNLPMKVGLIRQILAMNPEDALEWERNLTSLEEEWKGHLQEAAKQAILAGDFQELRQLQETMQEEPWRTPIHESVLQKIEQVLEEADRRAKMRLCEQLIGSSEAMLVQPKRVKDAAAALAKVAGLLNDGIQLEPSWLQRYMALAERAKTLQAQAAAEERFAKLFYELDQKMAHNAPIEQVDNIFYEMQRLRREIPEITMRKVETYRQNALLAAKRKKLIVLGGSIVAILLLLGIGCMLFLSISKQKSIEEYCSRIRTSIDDQLALSDEGYEILKEIEAKVPAIREAKEITKLADELAAKRKSEEERRARFKELQLTITTQLENYAENAVSIVENMKEIQSKALPEHQKELDALTQLHDERRAKYVRAQDTAYRKLCGDAGDAFIAVKAQIAEHQFDAAREYLPTIAEKLKQAGEISDVSFDAKNGQKSLVEEYAQAAKIIDQARVDFGIEGRLKELETQMTLFAEMVESQKLAEAKEICQKIYEKLKALEGEIKGANSLLRSQFSSMQGKSKTFDKQLIELRSLIEEEEKEFTNVFSNADSLQLVKEALQDYQAKYPRFFNGGEVAKLLNELTDAQAGKMAEYDTALHERSKRFKQLYEKIGQRMQDELLKRRDANRRNPIYMLGFINQENNVPVNLYLKKGDVGDGGQGVKFNKRLGINTFIIKGSNLLGLDDSPDTKLELDNNKLTVGSGATFPIKLEYPRAEVILSNKAYNSLGHYGEWLAGIKNDTFDFRDIAGWVKLDKQLSWLLMEKSDGVRSVHEWSEIIHDILTNAPALQQGGEFEATEILALQQELLELMKILPEGSKWYSASWEHQNETGEFYRKLKDFHSNPPKERSIAMAMQRLLMNSREVGKTLVPCGVMAWREINGKSNWYFYPVNLPVNTEGELFAVDNGRRESMKVGDYTYHNMTLHWSFNGSSEFHKGYYVVFIKK